MLPVVHFGELAGDYLFGDGAMAAQRVLVPLMEVRPLLPKRR